MFDASIGAGTVMMPYGGTYQQTEIQTMVAKLPVLEGKYDAVTMMSYGFDPYLSSWSPYHGAVYAVLTSVAKIAAAGGDYKKIRFTFQEYFRRMSERSDNDGASRLRHSLVPTTRRWASDFRPSAERTACPVPLMRRHGEIECSADPGFLRGGCGTARKNMISPEFKKAGNKIVVFTDLKEMTMICRITPRSWTATESCYEDIKAGRDHLRVCGRRQTALREAVSKMAFGNQLGVKIEHNVDPRDFFAPAWGNIVCEVPDGQGGRAFRCAYTCHRRGDRQGGL